LRPLDESSGRAMLDAILGISSTTFDLKGRIIRHTANVPLFVEEVCRRLKETGVLQGEWGNLTLDRPVDDLGIPNSVQGVIAARPRHAGPVGIARENRSWRSRGDVRIPARDDSTGHLRPDDPADPRNGARARSCCTGRR